MASFALYPICAGFKYDMPHGMIGFNPVLSDIPYKTFFGLGTCWGTFTKDKDSSTIKLTEGSLTVKTLSLPYMSEISSVTADGISVPYTFDGTSISFDKPLCVHSEIIVK
jgi:hypothetical protein